MSSGKVVETLVTSTQDFSRPDDQTTQSNFTPAGSNHLLYYLFRLDCSVRFYISLMFKIRTN